MSWWPWTSKARLEDVRAELERYRADTNRLMDELRTELREAQDRNGFLLEHITRMARRDSGMPEMPIEPRKPMGMMPKRVFDYLQGIYPPSLQRAEREHMLKKVAGGQITWDEIEGDLEERERFRSGGPEDALAAMEEIV